MNDHVTPRRRAELKMFARPGCLSVWSDDEVVALIRQVEDLERMNEVLNQALGQATDNEVALRERTLRKAR